MNYVLYRAGLNDLKNVVDLVYPNYFQESIYSKKMNADPVGIAQYFHAYLSNPLAFCVAAKDETGKLVAFCSMELAKTFYKELEADINFFYVSPDFRGTGCAREMVDAMAKVAKDNSCGVIYACSASAIDEGKNDHLWVNLFKKKGFTVIGTTLAKFEVE